MSRSNWFRADLHFHTPKCYSYSKKTDVKVALNEAVENRIEMIALTDHNSFNYDQYIEFSNEFKSIEFMPGIELNMKDPNHKSEYVHVILIFNPEDANIVESTLKSTFGTLGATDSASVKQVAELRKKIDFIAIPHYAKSDGKRNISKETAKKMFISEIIDMYEAGSLHRINKLNAIFDKYSIPVTTIIGSDFNGTTSYLEKWKSREGFLHIKTNKSFYGLKNLKDTSDLRVRMTFEEELSNENYISEIDIEGETIQFDDQLNLLIGKKGSGKSHLLKHIDKKYDVDTIGQSVFVAIDHVNKSIEDLIYEQHPEIKETLSNVSSEVGNGVIKRLFDLNNYFKSINNLSKVGKITRDIRNVESENVEKQENSYNFLLMIKEALNGFVSDIKIKIDNIAILDKLEKVDDKYLDDMASEYDKFIQIYKKSTLRSNTRIYKELLNSEYELNQLYEASKSKLEESNVLRSRGKLNALISDSADLMSGIIKNQLNEKEVDISLESKLQSKRIIINNKLMFKEESISELENNLTWKIIQGKKMLAREEKLLGGSSSLENNLSFKIMYKDEMRDVKYGVGGLSFGEMTTMMLDIQLESIEGNGIPLIIDQPEDNSDNQFIYEELSKIICKLKMKRQIFIATHNPILAIASDANQYIISEKINESEYKRYVSQIENPKVVVNGKNMKEIIIDILEGTRPSMAQRTEKMSVDNIHAEIAKRIENDNKNRK